MHEDLPAWQIVESENPVKRGMHRSYDYGGYESHDDPICKKCGYRRTSKITAVELYTFKRAQALKPRIGIRTLKDLL